MRDDFCTFIMSHGRADNVKTVKSLRDAGYTGKWYIVVDNEDDQYDKYVQNYGVDRVLMFDKLATSKTFDTGDTQEERRTIVYARNACFELAKQVGCRYFLELDDDYTGFEHRKVKIGKLLVIDCTEFDRLCNAMIDFLNESGAITVALAQGGDFIGGANSSNANKTLLRKAMNSFFCDVEKRFKFVGRINEDVNTYTTLGQRGELMFTVTDASLRQMTTQKNKGGMSDVYIDKGTFLKSFYTVMYSPSCVTLNMMGDKHMRIHHNVHWRNCVPCVLKDIYSQRRKNAI